VARRVIGDDGPEALQVVRDVAAVPCMQKPGETVDLWREIVAATCGLQAAPQPSVCLARWPLAIGDPAEAYP
jgi:hypothetical protein